jgi:8-oxo-dGTP pyrophosphatase MutT (NUDIX family)
MKQSVKNAYSRLFRSAPARRKASAPVEVHSTAPRAAMAPHMGTGGSALPLLGSNSAHIHPQMQSGVLAYRWREKNHIEILLVRKLRSRTWGIPKGKVKRRLSSAENAAKEAFEEAGVRGRVQARAAGTYRATKRKLGEKIVIEVSVHMLEVTRTSEEWPEKAIREVRWCSPQEAAKLLQEPMLVALCSDLRNIV